MNTEDAVALAHQVLEIIPLVGRTMAAEMRHAAHGADPSNFRLLWLLSHRTCTLSELAERQSVSLPTMSNSVTILEERGWVERTRSEEDRRKINIQLTPAGWEMLKEIGDHAAEKLAKVFEPLSDLDRETLVKGLEVLRQSFAAASEMEIPDV
jgi:DNA-binding MarR family transcriptional regulator